MEISHEPSWYDKEQLLSTKSTQLIYFNDFHIQQFSGPAITNKCNKHNVLFPRDEKGNIDVKTGKYDTYNQPKRANFKYEQEGILWFGVAKIKSKDGTITGKWCPVFDYSRENIVTTDALKKNTENICKSLKAYLIIYHNVSNNNKTDKLCLCEPIDKLKILGQQKKAKMNELIINSIYYL